MYKLYKIEDNTTGFIDYIITKDIDKTMEYLLGLFKQNNHQNNIIQYLIKNRKKFYDLQKTIIFQSDDLENVNKFYYDLINIDKPEIIKVKEEIKDIIDEVIKEKTPVIDAVEEYIEENIVEDTTEEISIEKPKKKSRSKKPIE